MVVAPSKPFRPSRRDTNVLEDDSVDWLGDITLLEPSFMENP